MEFYLRVEAVNLSNFIFDTTDLSTVRGGGLLLLKATEDDIKTEFSSCAEFEYLEAISTGASSGLFSFNSNQKPDELRKAVFKFLNEHHKFKHATFVIDILPVGKTFTEDKEKLLALNRWQQMQSPTVIFPNDSQVNVEHPICAVDHISPFPFRQIKKGDEILFVSDSVFQRHDYGRNKKQKFYRDEISKLPKQSRSLDIKQIPVFVSDLTELTDDKKRGNLNNKMAVIYLDGNSFGKIQHDICQGDDGKEALQLFDEQIKEYRRGFLHDLLKDTIGKLEWTYQDESKHRLETLLWGGDEILLVVPAWLGWWTLSYFFQKSKYWEFPDPNYTKLYPLTHAAGLVFCHHNAPIHQITKLAKELGELAKDKKDNKGKKIGRKANYVAYQVLESFDYAGEDLKSFRNKLCGESGLKSDSLIISGNEMRKALPAMEPIKRVIPKGKVYAIVQALLDTPTQASELIAEAETQLNNTVPIEFKQLQNCFGKGIMFWIHLIELWDYIEIWELIK